jgi:hypothetical protein
MLGIGYLLIFMLLLILGRLFGEEDPGAGYKSDW